MNNKESEYLNNLFSMSSDQIDETEIDFPLLDVPATLSDNLYAITAPTQSSSQSFKSRAFKSWPRFSSVAASLLIAVVLLLVYQQQQTIKQLEQAQTDLATALHYLGEANKITRVQMLNSLNANMNKAAIAPVVEIGRDAALQSRESLETATQIPNRSL